MKALTSRPPKKLSSKGMARESENMLLKDEPLRSTEKVGRETAQIEYEISNHIIRCKTMEMRRIAPHQDLETQPSKSDCQSHNRSRKLDEQQGFETSVDFCKCKTARIISLFRTAQSGITQNPMSRDYFPDVYEEYRRYTILLSDFKTVATNPLQVVPQKGGHLEIAKAELTHPDPFGGLEVEIRFKPAFPADYEFKLFWREVTLRPVFRFETWGEAHNNHENGTGLPARKVPTPHFHRIESNGRMWAYRTAFLDQADKSASIREDYSVGVKHFCQEAKIQDSNGADVVVATLSSPIGKSISTDALNGVSFQ